MVNKFRTPFAFDGHVVDLMRSLDKLVMQLETSSGLRNIEMPIKIKNDFELIPYQIALMNQKVKYAVDEKCPRLEGDVSPNTRNERYSTLSILTGSLKGKTYRAKENW